MDESLYGGREQSWVKHRILERYLLRLALIIGQVPNRHSITYVDCFSGPWKSKSETYSDTSFAIAIKQLRDARTKLADLGHDIKLRAFFIESNKGSYRELEEYVQNIDDVDIEIRNQKLEDTIDDICNFVNAARRVTFPFIFIDPTGWTGFALDTIRPLLELEPCEFLINFMTEHVIRFLENELSRKSFERMFGSADFKDELKGKRGEERVDTAVFKYRDAVSEAGNFRFSGIAGILNPNEDRSHFHLIYLSRHPKGLEVFKEAEKKSMKDMEQVRAQVEQTKREKVTGQRELFPAQDAPESRYYRYLRARYLVKAKSPIEHVLNQGGRISYDKAWENWLQYPLVWESDLKEWVVTSEKISIEGLKPRARKPQRGKNHFLVKSHDV